MGQLPLAEKYTRLKRKISGNREQFSYEETFGTPMEERYYVTLVAKWNKRILSEIEFAISLSEELGGKYDELLHSIIDFMTEKINEESVLTKSVCIEAEEKLKVMSKEAKEYKVLLIAHAHIDMNWMWGWQETVASTLATFRTMLNLMNEYPDFCFSQSQASVYKIVEDFDPELMDEMKKRIKEGRWEITANAWVETDKNMPNTESLLRHIRCTKDYLKEHWDIDPASLEVDFSPDTFGHNANIPEINNFANVKYYYHCRGLDIDHNLYRWRSPSGKEILMNKEHFWYNAAVTPKMGLGLVELSHKNGGLKTALGFYGVGNHGGGPTRRDIETAYDIMDWPVFPTYKFGTLREFFHEAETVRENLPIVDRELNFFSPGCYTTQSRIKMGNIKCERALAEAEAFSTFAGTVGYKYKHSQFEKAWQNVLFTHFHDILTGSCVIDTREHAMGLFSEAMAVANTQSSNALRVLSENIDTSSICVDEDIDYTQSEGAGAGYGVENYTGVPSPERGKGMVRIFHVFNSRPSKRKEIVEITVWDWVGDMRRIVVTDKDNNHLNFTLLDSQHVVYWDHRYFRMLVEVEVPAMGHTTIIMNERHCEKYPLYFNGNGRIDRPYNNFILENEHIKAEFDFKDGKLISFIDKEFGENLLQCGKRAELQVISAERATADAWQIGRYTKIEPISDVRRIYATNYGELRNGFVVERKYNHSIIKEIIYLEKHSKAITYKFDIDWQEPGSDEFVPLLVFNFPLGYETERYLYDVPGGAQVRGPLHIDVPALQYGAGLSDYGNSVTLISDSKYGHRGYDNQLAITLLNNATYPDKYPETFQHKTTVFVGLEKGSAKAMGELAAAVNNPFRYTSNNRHNGKLLLEESGFCFESETAIMSSIETDKDGDVLVRFYETEGKDAEVGLSFSNNIMSAVRVNLVGEVVNEPVTVDRGTAKTMISPYSLGCVKLRFYK